MYRINIGILVFIFGWNILSAQLDKGISADELAMTVYGAEPEADAVILSKESKLSIFVSDTYTTKHENYVRIKILSEEGLKWSDFSFDYHFGDGYESVRKVKGRITYPNGTFYELKKKDISRIRLNSEWRQLKLSFPNPVPGCIIEYSYEIIVNDVFPVEDFIFQYEIPLRKGKILFDIDDRIKYSFQITNEERVKTIQNGFLMEEIPSIKTQPFVDNLNNYRGRIKTIIEGVLEYNELRVINRSWAQQVEELRKYEYFGQPIYDPAQSRVLWSKAAKLKLEGLSFREQLQKLQGFILSQVEWDGSYDVYSNSRLDDILLRGNANSAELNMMMAALLMRMEVTVVPCLVKARSNGRASDKNRLLEQFDHVILLVEKDGETLFLDIMDPFKAPYAIRPEMLNKEALVLVENPVWVTINSSITKSIHVADLTLDKNGLNGIIQSKSEGHYAYEEKFLINEDASGSFWEERIRINHPRAYVDSFKVLSHIAGDNEISTQVGISIPDGFEINRDTVFLYPVIFSRWTKNPFTEAKRVYPVDFVFPQEEYLIFNFYIPESFQLIRQPDPISVISEDGKVAFHFSVQRMNGKIQVVRKLTIKNEVVNPADYSSVFSVFSLLEEKSNEPVVLLKKQGD